MELKLSIVSCYAPPATRFLRRAGSSVHKAQLKSARSLELSMTPRSPIKPSISLPMVYHGIR